MTTDDASLINRYQQGDRNALDVLIARHKERAFNQALRLTHDSEQADDVVAEAFLKVCKSLGQFQGKSSFATWLYRIIMNSYIDARQRALSRPSVSLDAWLVADVDERRTSRDEMAQDAQCEVDRQVEAACLKHAISRLPVKLQTIVEMHYVYAMSYEDMTCALKLPIGTVKSRLCRARAAMRRILEADEQMLMPLGVSSRRAARVVLRTAA